ncbi:restriction endonuclease subunit S [Mucilaginibacter sp.]|uniref:restriction endonuclease subunit S n=1 Tax=Mucilaginibacter sp. TaxID=1882438 RepID=UPI002843C499|nr:restriction endonuclease subunit S [Mucilaginibacter sp.]MDR3695386.1 restriction endonuclease subunit S [Mucilaginibacter sp.]
MDFKNLIEKIGFQPKENSSGIFCKKYPACNNYCIEIDIDNSKFNYGVLIKTGAQTTLNFSQAENWVILECVDRLLEKGYKPENIILEKVYPAGHGFSGRLDICVTHDDGSEYLLIECKTYGKEFEKAVARLNKDGGQLFTYFKFSNKADVIMLYASELNVNTVVYKNEIVKIEDDYRTGDVKDFYDKWNKLTKDNGVFDSWVNPYQFVSKALTPKLLVPIKQEDSNFIFIRFLEILRNNVVSDEGNAFNKIFTLFLCKVYDEKSTKDTEELKFQWFEGKDDDVSFQLRLTDLYKNGMLEFLEKEVSDFTENAFEEKFKHLKPEDKRELLLEIHKLRLEKNNEFAIKEVFDHQSFKENAKVVKQVVELLQGYRIRYNKRQQYLSDFFELLLTTGLKQKVGQYFTPVPIAQFIIKSLPIDKIVNEKLEKGERNNLLPFVIDYAAGSGHFLTESMHEIQRHLDNKKPDDYISDTAKKIKTWQDDHFDWATQYVYGIEKDYRLVKVGKVGCYLHGDGLANVILSDGLANFKNTKEYKGLLKKTDADFPKENKQFDIVLSNPPYAVPAFRLNAREYYTESDFELYSSLTDQSGQIEALFIERTKQLLKDGGLAGIILPSSILNNEGIYTKAREIILQFFDIVAIVELGSNTFMATGTSTVTLFLRRKNNYHSRNLKIGVDSFFNNLHDVTLNGIESPVSKYVNHVWDSLSFADYITLLQRQPNSSVEKHPIYVEYKKKIRANSEKEFWQILLDKENEKLYYFIIVFPQKVVLIKSGKKAAEKRFLGYEFSNRKGSQGIHPIKNGKNIEDCTSLFDPQVFDNPEKASSYIYKAFNGDFTFAINENLKKNISRNNLADLLAFDRVEFEKSISLSIKKKVRIESQWKTVKISEILTSLESGNRPEGGVGEYQDGIPSIGGEHINLEGTISLYNMKFVPEEYFNNSSQGVIEDLDILICKDGALTGKIALFRKDNFPYKKGMINEHIFILRTKEAVTQKYLFNLLYSDKGQEILKINVTGAAQGGLNRENLLNIQIPLPPNEIQKKIISEIEKIEEKKSVFKKKLIELENSIMTEFTDLDYDKKSLGNIAAFKNGLNYSRSSKGEIIDIVGVKDFQNLFTPNLNTLEKIQIDGMLSDEYRLQPKDILVVRSNGSANLVGRFLFIEKLNTKTSYSGFTIRIRPDAERVDAKYLCYYLKTDIVRNELTGNSKGSNIKSLNQTLLSSVKIPLPPLSIQQKIVSEIEVIEREIAKLEEEISSVPQKKELVLKKYL